MTRLLTYQMNNLWYILNRQVKGFYLRTESIIQIICIWVMGVVTLHSSRTRCSKWWEFKNCDGDQYGQKPGWVLPWNISACLSIYFLSLTLCPKLHSTWLNPGHQRSQLKDHLCSEISPYPCPKDLFDFISMYKPPSFHHWPFPLWSHEDTIWI